VDSNEGRQDSDTDRKEGLMIQRETRKTIHMGVNFVLTHMPILDTHFSLDFQQSLTKSSIAYSTVTQLSENKLAIVRNKPTPLRITVGMQGPPDRSSVGQLLIVAPFPERSLDSFGQEADRVVRAFEAVSSPPQRQVLSKDATLRDLYETGGSHAFQVLWEVVLGQQREALQKLGREVLGGGLRLVMPPRSGEPDPVTIELKVESYLQDSSMLFLETQMAWRQPGMEVIPLDLLNKVEQYITETALDFLGVE
jgi:hypothetical protein